MAVVIRNTATPGSAINFNGAGVALTVKKVPAGGAPAEQNWNLTAGPIPVRNVPAGLTVTAVPAPNDPVSPVGNNLVPNNPVNRWNFVPVAGSQFEIQNPANGDLWGVGAGNEVMLGAGNPLWCI